MMSQAGVKYDTAFPCPFRMCLISARRPTVSRFLLNFK